jgi:hypothetical protein
MKKNRGVRRSKHAAAARVFCVPDNSRIPTDKAAYAYGRRPAHADQLRLEHQVTRPASPERVGEAVRV